MSLAELEKRAALQILSFLYKNNKATRTELRDNVEASLSAIYSTLPILMKLGLIEEKTLGEFPFSVVISLTKKGKKIALHLVEIENLLKIK